MKYKKNILLTSLLLALSACNQQEIKVEKPTNEPTEVNSADTLMYLFADAAHTQLTPVQYKSNAATVKAENSVLDVTFQSKKNSYASIVFSPEKHFW